MAPVSERLSVTKWRSQVGLIKYRYVDVRPHRYQHCTLTLFVGPTVRVSGWPPCTFRKKIGIDKYGFSTSDQKQSRHAKQVKSVVQHVTKHKPLVLRNGCDIKSASNGRPSHVQQICTNAEHVHRALDTLPSKPYLNVNPAPSALNHPDPYTLNPKRPKP